MAAPLFQGVVREFLDCERFGAIHRLAVRRGHHGQLVRQGRPRTDLRLLERVCFRGQHLRRSTGGEVSHLWLRVSLPRLLRAAHLLCGDLLLRHRSITERCW